MLHVGTEILNLHFQNGVFSFEIKTFLPLKLKKNAKAQDSGSLEFLFWHDKLMFGFYCDLI